MPQFEIIATEDSSQILYEAIEDGVCVAHILTRWVLKPKLLQIGGWDWQMDRTDLRDALCQRIRDDVRSNDAELFIQLSETRQVIYEVLLANGFWLNSEKLLFERDLDTLITPLATLSLAKISELMIPNFIDCFQACNEGDPDSLDLMGQTPADFYVAFISTISDLHDPELVYLVLLEDEEIGVLLFRLEEYQDARRGLINYLGLLPACRGKGLGVEIHRLAMWHLRELGCSIYLGSTTTDNLPMLQVFEINHCSPVARQVFLRA